MKIQLDIEAKPFTVPNFVVYSDFNGNQKDSVPIASIPESALFALCLGFVKGVYAKANKQDAMPSFVSKR